MNSQLEGANLITMKLLIISIQLFAIQFALIAGICFWGGEPGGAVEGVEEGSMGVDTHKDTHTDTADLAGRMFPASRRQRRCSQCPLYRC